MNHPDEGTIESLVHGELAPDDRAAVDAHLSACVDCRARRDEARESDRWVMERLAVLEGPAPYTSASRTRAMARHRESHRGWRRAAAIVALSAGSGALFAMPSVRAWLRQIASPGVESARPAELGASAPSAAGQGPAIASSSGVSVEPGPRFVIVLDVRPDEGRLRIRESDRADLLFVAHGPPVRLESRTTGIRVYSAGARSDYDIEVPRSARDVEVRVGETSLYRRLEGRWVQSVAEPDAEGWRVSELGARRRD
jgi:hypothetical protein